MASEETLARARDILEDAYEGIDCEVDQRHDTAVQRLADEGLLADGAQARIDAAEAILAETGEGIYDIADAMDIINRARAALSGTGEDNHA
jgi:hypothetical protein